MYVCSFNKGDKIGRLYHAAYILDNNKLVGQIGGKEGKLIFST